MSGLEDALAYLETRPWEKDELRYHAGLLELPPCGAPPSGLPGYGLVVDRPGVGRREVTALGRAVLEAMGSTER